jgi:sugar/nucleoside kinase (ribokinase family)
MNKVTVIGAAIVDIMAAPVDKDLFTKGSVPAKKEMISCGGDALNEAVVLSGLGVDTEITTLLGKDEMGETVLRCLRSNAVSLEKVTLSSNIATGMNIVLVDSDGERYFITNPESTLRKLSKEHILPYVESMGDIVSFASIFVSAKLTISDMEEVFRAVKEKKNRIFVADMTRAKNGETIEDIVPLLKYIDYIIPNESEASALTGEIDPRESARCFIEHGAQNVIIKCGKDGCIYRSAKEGGIIPAYPAADVIDTTGAGDSFVAGFIYGLTKGLATPDCCRYGCAASSVVVEHMGTQHIPDLSAEAEKRYKIMK